MQLLYRISSNGYVKTKLPNATKVRCLLNLLTHWPNEEVTVFADRVSSDVQDFLDLMSDTADLRIIPIDGGSSAASWRIVRDYALENFDDSEVVYFVEDDYFHLDHSRRILLEGMVRADYVTLYDAPDKYVPGKMGGNPYIDDDGADVTKVYLTASSHWRLTNSTTMTFATHVKTLRTDKPIWDKWTETSHPHDFQAFLELGTLGRSVISPIPSLSTHVEPSWLAPLIDWESI